MHASPRVLVVGATGYLGSHVVRELKHQGYWVRVLSRNTAKIAHLRPYVDEVFLGEATRPSTLDGLCDGIDIVFSALGITRQKEGLTYMDVDYQGNLNILNAALAAGVGKFMYISALNADQLRHIQLLKAKERFVDVLKAADITAIIVRPNGYFSDMTELLTMARHGRVYLFGRGEQRINPIHGADLAQACVEYLPGPSNEIAVGGPEVLTLNAIAHQAFAVVGRKPRITYIPLWVKHVALGILRRLTPVRTYGPIEFLLTVLTRDMLAPPYGRHTIADHFREVYLEQIAAPAAERLSEQR